MKSPAHRSLKGVLTFTASYMTIATFRAVTTGNSEFGGYLGVMIILIACLYAVHRRCPLTPGLLWTFCLWGMLHMAGGLIPIPPTWVREGNHMVLYSWWLIPGYLRYDQVVHAYGFGITTWLCWHILQSALQSPGGMPVRPTIGILALCVAAGMGFGALNEVVEFAMTMILPDTNVGDYANVGWDLVSNLVGGIIAVTIIRWRKCPRCGLKCASRSCASDEADIKERSDLVEI